jgi:hypothetical protein
VTKADVAELVDARDLKPCGLAENAQPSCKTATDEPIETDGNPAFLQNSEAPHEAAIQALNHLIKELDNARRSQALEDAEHMCSAAAIPVEMEPIICRSASFSLRYVRPHKARLDGTMLLGMNSVFGPTQQTSHPKSASNSAASTSFSS